MRRLKKVLFSLAAVFIITGFAACAEDCDFGDMPIPRVYTPPSISNVMHTSAQVGNFSFRVYAKIEGRLQTVGVCDVVPASDCSVDDWYLVNDPDITPNPPTINHARLYYYLNGDYAGAQFVVMTYDADFDLWVADVPITGFQAEDTVYYYITAVDSMGNVAAQQPEPGDNSCSVISSWGGVLGTPIMDSCSYAESYNQCFEYHAGVPSCPSEYTMGDRNDDVCGEPAEGACGMGEQSVLPGEYRESLDIRGLTMGANDNFFCSRLGLKDGPHSYWNYVGSSSEWYEWFALVFINPDEYDPNPADPHVTNMYAITRIPEYVESNMTTFAVLWDGGCLTDPGTIDPQDCRIQKSRIVYPTEDFYIAYQSGVLRFNTKISGANEFTGEPYNLMGRESGYTVVMGMTGELGWDGGRPFWVSDTTQAMAFYHDTHKQAVTLNQEMPPPLIMSMDCLNVEATSENTCIQASHKPEYDECSLYFRSPYDIFYMFCAGTSYNIYRNTVDDIETAEKIAAIEECGQGFHTFNDKIYDLDGTTYYYYLTTHETSPDRETALSDAPMAHCTVEDWGPPEPPVITRAATPEGTSGACEITWTDSTDSSAISYYFSRNGTPINQDSPLLAAPGAGEYTFTDPAVLTLGLDYYYSVTAVDAGGNTTTSDLFACTAEDLKPPSKIPSLVVTNACGLLGAEMRWQPPEDGATASYQVNYCVQDNPMIDCVTSDGFLPLNTSPLEEPQLYVDGPMSLDLGWDDGNYCFYVQACDDCAAEGTCPSNDGASNCSGFPAEGSNSQLYVKCLTLEEFTFDQPLAWPQGLSCEALPRGGAIQVSWDQLCSYANGEPLDEYCCDMATQLAGYEVITGQAGAVPLPAEALPQDIVGVVSANQPDRSIVHSGLENGQEYCYNVTGVSTYCGGYSEDGPGGYVMEVCCTPLDTQPPDKPEMQDIPFTSISCSPTWNKVEDESELTYNVYRCAGDPDACSSEEAFSQVASGVTEVGALTYADYGVTTNAPYNYCITATDGSSESAIYEADDLINCGQCVPSDRPSAPTDVSASSSSDYENAEISWTDSTDDAGTGGYNVYTCADEDCTSPQGPVESCVSGNRTSSAPLSLSCGDPGTEEYYFAVSYMRDCADSGTNMESYMGITAEAFQCTSEPTCEGDCDYLEISSCNDYSAGTSCIPVTLTDTTQTDSEGLYIVIGRQGLQVYLMDASGNPVGQPATTDEDGNFRLLIDRNSVSLDPDEEYQVVVKVPAAEKSGVLCSPGFSGDDCYIVINDEVETLEDDAVRVSGVSLGGGGRAEVGNANCDESVDVSDLLILKAAFGSSSGDTSYKTYADFNGDGYVDVQDFLIFKKNFGKNLDQAPAFEASLCKPE